MKTVGSTVMLRVEPMAEYLAAQKAAVSVVNLAEYLAGRKDEWWVVHLVALKAVTMADLKAVS